MNEAGNVIPIGSRVADTGMPDCDGDIAKIMLEALKVDVAEQIDVEMERQGVTRAELSRRLSVSRSAVTQLLNGIENLTLETLLKISMALNCEVIIGLHDVRRHAKQETPGCVQCSWMGDVVYKFCDECLSSTES